MFYTLLISKIGKSHTIKGGFKFTDSTINQYQISEKCLSYSSLKTCKFLIQLVIRDETRIHYTKNQGAVEAMRDLRNDLLGHTPYAAYHFPHLKKIEKLNSGKRFPFNEEVEGRKYFNRLP